MVLQKMLLLNDLLHSLVKHQPKYRRYQIQVIKSTGMFKHLRNMALGTILYFPNKPGRTFGEKKYKYEKF